MCVHPPFPALHHTCSQQKASGAGAIPVCFGARGPHFTHPQTTRRSRAAGGGGRQRTAVAYLLGSSYGSASMDPVLCVCVCVCACVCVCVSPFP